MLDQKNKTVKKITEHKLAYLFIYFIYKVYETENTRIFYALFSIFHRFFFGK